MMSRYAQYMRLPHFLAEFSTSEVDPLKLQLPERLFKYVHPWHWKNTEGYSNPENACNAFLALSDGNEEDTSNFRDCLISELYTAAGNISNIEPFLTYWDNVSRLNSAIFSHVGNQFLSNFNSASWDIYRLPEIRQKLIQHTEKGSPRFPQIPAFPTHRYAIRHWMFLHKLLEMPSDGHCLCVGSPLNQVIDICKLATTLLDVHLEDLPVELTHIRWRETLMKVARLCALENRKVLLFVTDSIYNKSVFKEVLTDLIVTMNCGSLPPSLFSAQLLVEFREKKLTNNNDKSNIASQKDMSEWHQKEAIGAAIRTHLHVVFCVERVTVAQLTLQFQQLANYAILADFDCWSDSELLDFAKFELQKSRLFAENQPEELGNALMKAFKFAMSKNKEQLEPQKFLVFVKEYVHLVERKRSSLELLDKRYKTGISKLVKANEQMHFLKQELLRLQPELVRTSLETTALMSSLERETIEIENAREVVAANEFKANEAATKAQALKAECEREVTDAIPALETAIDALQILNQNDISTLKTMRFPPQGVRLCMEAVCILLGEKPTKSIDQTGNITIDYWPTSQKVLSDIHFLTRIRTFPRDRVGYKTMKLIRNDYLSKPEFDAEVMKQVSLAAEGLCLWVKALDIYNKIAKVVAPKKEKLKKAELMVKQHMKQLDHRRKALQEVTERLQRLSDQFSHMSQRKQELQNQIQSCETRMTRAEKLTSSLENERKRWDENLKLLKVEGSVYKQNALLVATYIYLLGDVSIDERINLMPTLQKHLNWPTEDTFNLRSMLQHNSILLDASSSSSDDDPYVILELTSQTPLIIDSQGESSRILRRLIPGTIITTDMHSGTLSTDIASTIGNGHTLIVDNLCEPLPLCLMQLMCPKFITDSQQTSIQIESRLFPYNSHSRLILRTEKPSSSFSKLLLQHLCVINVAVGEHIVRDKLMNIFVLVNAFPLTQKMDQLLIEKTNLMRQTDTMEDQILENLVKSKDLDDDRCVDMLVEIRGLAATMKEKDAESEVIRAQLDELKEKFIKIGIYGTKLINASLNVAKLSSFYKRTLKFYLDVFQMSVAMPSETLDESCIGEIKKNVLKMFRFKVSRSLFAEHRRVFEFLVSGVIPLKELPTTSESVFAKYFTNLHTERTINLRDQIIYAELTMPIVLLLSSQSDYVIRTLFSIAEFTGSTTSPASTGHGRRRSVQLVSSEDFLESDWMQVLENDQWLIVLNCETLDAGKLNEVNKLAKTILASDVRKSSFRLFFVVYPDKELASHSLFDSSTVITVDDSKLPFTAFINYCYSSLGPSRVHSTLQTSYLRKQLFKLCCFHFAIFQRTQFGIFGFANPLNVSLSNLECAVKLFEGTMPSTPTPNFDAIWRSVIDIAYSTSDLSDRKVMQTLGQWVFEGVNKFDDRALDGIWPKDFNQSLGMFKMGLTEMKDINDWILSGLGKCVIDELQKVELRKTHQSIVSFLTESEVSTKKTGILPTEMLITKTVSTGDGKASIEQCLCHELQFLEENGIFLERKTYIQNLLKNSPIREIALYFVERPEAIVETLRFSYARSLRTGLEEVETVGIVRGAMSNDAIKLVDVYLLGAGLKPESHILVDSNHAFSRIEGLQIVARRKAARSPAVILVPLLYKSKLDSTTWRHIVNVEVESQLPESHWLLHGVKFITCEDCVKFLTAK
uniref:AAA_9 domain-containing protein n=1 Tax=Panagrellus redivivus TaxID=6233 RepID=A0A7E4W8T1_PANRE